MSLVSEPARLPLSECPAKTELRVNRHVTLGINVKTDHMHACDAVNLWRWCSDSGGKGTCPTAASSSDVTAISTRVRNGNRFQKRVYNITSFSQSRGAKSNARLIDSAIPGKRVIL